jgi:hypothetical protein
VTIPFEQACDSGKELDYRCIMVEFVASDHGSFKDASLLHVSATRRLPDHFLLTEGSTEAFLEGARDSKKREIPDVVKLHVNSMVEATGHFKSFLQVQLVLEKRQPDNEEFYIGANFFCSDDLVHTFKFHEDIKKLENTKVGAIECDGSLLIDSDDGKMAVCLHGLSTCGLTYPCPRCLHRLDSSKFPIWFHDEFPDLVEKSECESPYLREGEYSYAKCWERFKVSMGHNHQYSAAEAETTPAAVEASKSVVNKPLRVQQLKYFHGEPMHILMG